MTRFVFKILFLVLLPISAQAQPRYVDSLRHELAVKKDDSDKVKLFNRLGSVYYFSYPDSAIYYGEKALQLAQEIGSKPGEASAYTTLWIPYFAKGEYARALDYSYKQLHIYEELGDEQSIATAQMAFANIYREQGDLNRALEHVFTWKKLYDKLHLTNGNYAINIHGNLSLIYEQANQLDSALVHARAALDTAKSIGRMDNYIIVINTVIGDVYRKRKEYIAALEYYIKALPVFSRNKMTKDLITTRNAVAECYLGLGKIDSALIFAISAYALWQPGNFLKGSQQTAELMARIYKVKGLNDSAISYLELSNRLKDSIYSQSKVREVQNLAFEEQKREQQLQEAKAKFKRQLWTYGIIVCFIGVIILTGILWRNNRQKQKAKIKIEKAYEELKATQQQLIQSEKMASLGELTAGIAHEIQNPLNFVNNFSEVNTELVDELKIKKEKLKISDDEIDELLNDIYHNNEKISMHGKRADAIVKGMLQHSRTSSGQRELTDINALCDEYLRLAYHGLRAKDKTFNAEIKTDFDNSIEKMNIVPQDIGRVILNLINNAFYAVNERRKVEGVGYEPTVAISTASIQPPLGPARAGTDGGRSVQIKVTDNGGGIPQNIVDKIFQPFFTTKPTGQGTGLGLSLAYDIVKANGGEIKVETKQGERSEFIIQLPVV